MLIVNSYQMSHNLVYLMGLALAKGIERTINQFTHYWNYTRFM